MTEKNEQAPIFFWRVNEKYGFLSNWYPSDFVVDGVTYHDSEQYFMAGKARLFGDAEIEKAILEAKDPKAYKALGRIVSPFEPKIWDENKLEIMKKANLEKFSQNPELKKKLLATGDALLEEASPKDKIWGIGLDAKKASVTPKNAWPGEGLLGKVLMEVREELKGQ